MEGDKSEGGENRKSDRRGAREGKDGERKGKGGQQKEEGEEGKKQTRMAKGLKCMEGNIFITALSQWHPLGRQAR